MLSHKMDFNCCANRDGFCRDSHNLAIARYLVMPCLIVVDIPLHSALVTWFRLVYTLRASSCHITFLIIIIIIYNKWL